MKNVRAKVLINRMMIGAYSYFCGRNKHIEYADSLKEIIVINELPEMITELRRIGNNINQLTRLANSRIITCVDLEDTKKELQKLWQSLNLLTTKSV